MKKYLRPLVGFVLVAGLFAWLSAPEGKSLSTVATLALIVGFSLFAARPSSRAFAKAHPRAMRVAGVAFILAMFAVVALPVYSPELGLSSDLSVNLAVGCMVCAAFLFTLPITAGRMDAIQRVADQRKATEASVQTPKAKFSGPEAVLGAVLFLAAHPYTLLRVVGSWALLFWAALLTASLGLERLKAAGLLSPGLGILLLFVVLAVVALSLPLAAVGWACFTATAKIPPIARPGVVWSYVWRMWLVSSIGGTLQEMLAPQAQLIATSLGHGEAELVGRVIIGLSYVLIALGLAKFALVLPAIAVGDRTVTTSLYGVAAQRLGRSYILGVPLILAPFALAGWALALQLG